MSSTYMSTEQRDNICAWLRANGIDPKSVPEGARPSLIGDQLTIDLYVRNAAGRMMVVGAAVARTTATVTVAAPPPPDVARWLRPA
jgi:hypothetical protein